MDEYLVPAKVLTVANKARNYSSGTFFSHKVTILKCGEVLANELCATSPNSE